VVVSSVPRFHVAVAGAICPDHHASVAALEAWLREQRRKLSARNEVAKAIQYSLNRWTALRIRDTGWDVAGSPPAQSGARLGAESRVPTGQIGAKMKKFMAIYTRPLGIAGALQGRRVRLEYAPHRGAARANFRRADRLSTWGLFVIFAISPSRARSPRPVPGRPPG
jgi:hypothetical protein